MQLLFPISYITAHRQTAALKGFPLYLNNSQEKIYRNCLLSSYEIVNYVIMLYLHMLYWTLTSNHCLIVGYGVEIDNMSKYELILHYLEKEKFI